MNDQLFKAILDDRPRPKGLFRKNILAEKPVDICMEPGDVAALTLKDVFDPKTGGSFRVVLTRPIHMRVRCLGLIAYLEDGKLSLRFRRE